MQTANDGVRWSPAEAGRSLGHRAGTAPGLLPRPGSNTPGPLALPELIGDHPLMLEVARRVRLVAPHSSTVLIQGASGTGKELIARAVHRLSPRHRRPFVALNCAAIPESLLETELFGHARGAFTGAVQRRTGRILAAQGGTLLLDEIGDMPLALQAKLLRFVESGELQPVGDNETVSADVRILAATHRPLAKLSREGTFRADLYYRLAVFQIGLPGLSARSSDIALLAAHFLARGGDREDRSPDGGPGRAPFDGRPSLNQAHAPCRPPRLTDSALEKLQAHSWPGNVRELEHVLARALILAGQRDEITAEEIEFSSDPPEY